MFYSTGHGNNAMQHQERNMTLNNNQQREISKTLPMIAHLGKDFGARVLSALYRSARKTSQQNEILAVAVAYGVVSSEEFII
jgi:hypothetical protein